MATEKLLQLPGKTRFRHAAAAGAKGRGQAEVSLVDPSAFRCPEA